MIAIAHSTQNILPKNKNNKITYFYYVCVFINIFKVISFLVYIIREQNVFIWTLSLNFTLTDNFCIFNI